MFAIFILNISNDMHNLTTTGFEFQRLKVPVEIFVSGISLRKKELPMEEVILNSFCCNNLLTKE